MPGAGAYIELGDFDWAISLAQSALQADQNISGAHAAAQRQKRDRDFLKAGAVEPAIENLAAAQLLNPAAPRTQMRLI